MSVWESRESRLDSFKELEDGWFGPGSIAPKHFIIDAAAEAFTLLDFGVIGHWAFGPYDGGIAFEHRETYIDDKLKSVVTKDSDVWVIPSGEDSYKIIVMLQEYMFDDTIFERNTESTTKRNPYVDIASGEQELKGTVDNIVLALQRKITWDWALTKRQL